MRYPTAQPPRQRADHLVAISVASLLLAASPATAAPLDPTAAVAKQAKSAFDGGRFADASRLYAEAWHLSAGQHSLLFSAAYAAHQGGLFDVANELYTKYLAQPLGPADQERSARAKVGLQSCKEGRSGQLEAEARQAQAQKDPGLAAGLYCRAHNLRPQRWELLYHCGRQLEIAGMIEDAERAYGQLLAGAPQEAPERLAATSRVKLIAEDRKKQLAAAEAAKAREAAPAANQPPPNPPRAAAHPPAASPASAPRRPPAAPASQPPAVRPVGRVVVLSAPIKRVARQELNLDGGLVKLSALVLEEPPSAAVLAQPPMTTFNILPSLQLHAAPRARLVVQWQLKLLTSSGTVALNCGAEEEFERGDATLTSTCDWRRIKVGDWLALDTMRWNATIFEYPPASEQRSSPKP